MLFRAYDGVNNPRSPSCILHGRACRAPFPTMTLTVQIQWRLVALWRGRGDDETTSLMVCAGLPESWPLYIASHVGVRDRRHAKGVGAERTVLFCPRDLLVVPRSITSDLPLATFYKNPNICTRTTPTAKDLSSRPSTGRQRDCSTGGMGGTSFPSAKIEQSLPHQYKLEE